MSERAGDSCREIAIFVNGPCDFSKEEVWSFFQEEPELLCADGGANILFTLGLIPEMIFGDLDSISDEALQYFQERSDIKKFPVRKDRSDLEIIIDYLGQAGNAGQREKKGQVVRVFGALGGRLDHQVGHLQLLEKAADYGLVMSLLSREMEVYLITTELALTGKLGELVSIFPVTGEAQVSLKGFMYEGDNLLLERGTTLGLSNSLAACQAEIKVNAGRVIIFKGK